MMRVELEKYNSLLSDTDICVLEDDGHSETDLNSQFVTPKFIDYLIITKYPIRSNQESSDLSGYQRLQMQSVDEWLEDYNNGASV